MLKGMLWQPHKTSLRVITGNKPCKKTMEHENKFMIKFNEGPTRGPTRRSTRRW